jgi:FtsP/CotA-like multicopper oxidase with cupredoxin domain
VVFPGRTVVATAFEKIHVRYENHIAKGKYILTGKDNTAAGHGDYSEESVVDTSIHWAYGAHGYMDYTIEKDGVPISIHLHGGHNDFQFDGNPEFFFSPNAEIIGPRWEGNFPEFFEYDNSQQAGLLFYHDHALGMTRLNVYSGMAGLYVIRDDRDTGTDENPLNLPAFPYEIGLAIMDKMFKSNGEQFYPAFPGDPYYADFINGEGATFPYGKPSLLAEFFGDFITVNGKIWPKMEVEPRLYRLRVLNACDSRFIVMHLVAVPLGETDPKSGRPLPFTVIGGDESVAIGSAIEIEHFMIVEPSSRYDILVDFSSVDGERVIMANAGGDEPFGGTVPGLQAFEHTNKVMAFDIVKELNTDVEEKSPIDSGPAHELYSASVTNVRRVGLFEGKDEYGRLQVSS